MTNDPIHDFLIRDAEQEEAASRLPECSCCGSTIYESHAIYYNGQWCCENCEYEFWQDIRDDFLEKVDAYDA